MTIAICHHNMGVDENCIFFCQNGLSKNDKNIPYFYFF